MLTKTIRVYRWKPVVAIITLILFSAFSTSLGRIFFMKTMTSMPTLHEVMVSHLLFSLSNSMLTAFVSTSVATLVVTVLYDTLFSMSRNLQRRIEHHEEDKSRLVNDNKHRVQEFIGAVVSLMTFAITMIMTLVATDDLTVIAMIVFVNILTSTVMYMFPYAKATQLKPMTSICSCGTYCSGFCSVKTYVVAKCKELFWTFLYSGVPEVGCIIFLYTLPNSSSLIQTYVATAWMQRQAVASVMSLQHAHYVHILLELILEFSKEQRRNGNVKLSFIKQICFEEYSVYQGIKSLITCLSFTFHAGGVYWITAINGVGKTSFLRSLLYMLKGMYVMCNNVMIPVAYSTIRTLEQAITYFNARGPIGQVKIDKLALFTKWGHYASMLGLTQEQAYSSNHSDGEWQKWLLLYALETCGSVMILDETLSAISIDVRSLVIFKILPTFAKETGKIVLLVAHCDGDGDGDVSNLHKLVLKEEDGKTTLTPA
jgi:ABC-type molybdenum transport system ATPase subunit/photorepair protein PhrA